MQQRVRAEPVHGRDPRMRLGERKGKEDRILHIQPGHLHSVSAPLYTVDFG